MKKLINHIILYLLCAYVPHTYSQTFGNEWINYGQQYYSFKVYPENGTPTYFGDQSGVNTGVYMLDYNTLNAAGIPLSSISTANFQIFGREKEIPLYIADGGDSQLDPGDFILFYTQRNDGWLDSILYEDPNSIGNPYYSLYNDTINYFFTWNSSTNNLRYQIETDVNFSAYTPANYILYDRWQSNTGEYLEGERLSESSSSFYTPGEGWSSIKKNGVPGGYTWNNGASLPNIYQGAGAPDIEFNGMQISASNANSDSLGNHHLTWTAGTSYYTFIDTIWTGYKGIRLQSTIPNSVFPSSGVGNVKINIVDDLGAATDYQAISTWSYRYPRMPQFGGEDLVEFDIVNSSTEAKIRLDLSNLTYTSPIMFVHGDVPMMIPVVDVGGTYSALIPNSGNGVDQHVIYEDISAVHNVGSLTPINGNGFFTDYSSTNFEDALLMIYHKDLETASINYRDYRNSIAGGGYNSILANIDELYLQFGGGIEKHINAIRRFANYAYTQSTQKPVGLFIMGKGIKEATVGADAGYRKDVSLFDQSLIPSYGQPPSDLCITAGLAGAFDWAPLIPTGRISSRTDTDLQNYLDKMIEFEQEQDSLDVYDTPNKDWQKQVIHFAGGSDAQQQAQFQIYTNYFEYQISNEWFGGNVMRVYKSDSDPLNPAILQSVTDRISAGTSLLTYFGHASSTGSGFEINLDDPTNWNNQGRYPLMLVNSCYNGNIFLSGYSNSEEFVQTPNAGAIGYIASTNIGYAGNLFIYSKRLYSEMGYLSYGEPIGLQMQKAIQALEPSAPSGSNQLYYETTYTQMLLHGDPMLHLNHHNRPEIELLEENVWFTPDDLNLTVDSVEMHIYLKNLGRSIIDTFSLEVIRDFPGSNDDSVYNFQIPALHYDTEFTFKMPLQGNIGLGLNSFEVSVDLPSYVDEQYDELNNNRITKTLFIDVDGIIPVEPYEFAVVPIDSVTVKACANNPIADFNTYRFELDTIDFEGAPSPMHRYAIVSGYGGVKEVDPSQWILTSNPSGNGTLVCQDSVVYFWRVSIDGDTIWRESSFQYITGKEGWGQDHFFQFKKNGFSSINYNRTNRHKEFLAEDKTISVDVYNSCSNADYNAYYINGNQQEYGLCTCSPSLYVAIIDPVTHKPWGTHVGTENPNNSFGNANDGNNCRDRVEDYFIYRQNNYASMASFQNLVNNVVPDSFFILVYAPLYANYSGWESLDSAGIFGTFSALGSDSIIAGRPNLPFAFFCKKGNPNSVVEYCAQNSTDDFTMNAILDGYDYTGIEESPLIGPANAWGNVYWKQDPLEGPTTDTTILTINAYNSAGNWQTSYITEFTANDSILNLNGLIDAGLYPYISLEATYEDTFAFTPAQIDRWHVLFSPLPEAAIDGTTAYLWTGGGTVNDGDNIQFAVDVKNIYSVDMDSLLISYWIEDENNIKYPISYPRQDSLKVGETFRDTIIFSTAGHSGINSFWMEVNPYIDPLLLITDQPEQMHFNNLLQIPFTIVPDTINPILDVTFDGNHILNGDIVSPTSEILITLKDENTHLIMDEDGDTTHFGVYLTDPAGNQVKIPFIDGSGNIIMQWTPATQQNRRFKIVWPGNFDKDGTYTLLVQGEDKSGNLSGSFEYRVNFEIVHESTITNMMNYPNPFSTSTRFVFTITGSEPPDDIIIQIMTVSGRVVREITEDQLGTITIGRNITEYAWDGTDEFGDPLANGVYLYRVKAQLNGQDIKHRDSGADQYFEKDFGKMYILR